MRAKKNPLLLIITLVGTMIVGGFIGNFLKSYLDIFGYNYPIGILNAQGNPWNIINLHVLKLSFGMVINVNLGSILGILLGLLIFYKR